MALGACENVRAGLGRRLHPGGGGFAADFPELAVEARDVLGEHLRLVREPGDRDREVKQKQQHEREGDQEQRVRRIGDPERAGDDLEEVRPDRQPQQDDRAAQPDERVALDQPAPPQQLEDDDEQPRARDDRKDLKLDLNRSSCSAVGFVQFRSPARP